MDADGRIQLVGQALAVLLWGFIVALVAVGIAGRDMGGRHQDGRERRAPPGIAAHGQRTQRVAVVALAARDEVRALGLADLHEVLARHLERGLHGLGAAADQVGVAGTFGRAAHQFLPQFLGHRSGEEAGVGIGQPVDLVMHGGDHVGMTVAQRGHGRTARGIDIAAPLRVADFQAAGGDGDGGRVVQVTMEHMAHGSSFKEQMFHRII